MDFILAKNRKKLEFYKSSNSPVAPKKCDSKIN